MGSRVLSGVSAHALLWPPVASSARPKLSFATPASSSNPSSSFPSSRLVISRAPLGVHVLVRRSRKETVLSRRASEEEGVETVDSAESEDVEAGEAVEEVEAKIPRKPIVKLGDIMGILNKRAIEASEKERPVPDIRVGDIVQIKLEVPENRRRASIYKGIVMSKQNAGIHTTIRIRRIIAGIGVEIVFPVYSPNIKELKVVSHRKVRRARLYYLREKLPRLSTFK